MNQPFALDVLKRTGALVRDSHIVYASGRHGKDYLNKDAVYANPFYTSELCDDLALKCQALPIDVVVGPAIGGVIIAQWVGYHLSSIHCKDILAVYLEKAEDGSFIANRGYGEYIKDKKILVVEDVLTTGGSAKKVVEAVRALRGEVVAVSAWVNRGGVSEKDVGDVPRLITLLDFKLDSWDANDCSLCRDGVPINKDFGSKK